MKTLLSTLAFAYQLKKWNLGFKDTIDTVSTDSGSLFITRNRHLQWFHPTKTENSVSLLHQRFFPKTIRNIVVKPKIMLVNMVSDDNSYVSESIVFSKGERFNIKWNDSTLYETIIDSNQYILRSNFFGKVSYGPSIDQMQESIIRMPNRVPYTTMTVGLPYLWCAGDYNIPEKGRFTRIDAYDIFSSSKIDTINPIPTYTFYMDQHNCAYPIHIRACIEECFPKKTLYLLVGYGIGGACISNVYTFPPTNNQQVIHSNLMPCSKEITSMAFDYPYIYLLEKHDIHMYHIPSVLSMPQYIDTHTVSFPLDYKYITQIVAIKRHVFWNGDNTVRSLEVML